MKTALTHILYLVIVWAIVTLALARWFNPVYAGLVQPHAGLALTGYKNTGTQSAPIAAFLCASFGVRPSMVKLKGTHSCVPVSCITGLSTLSALPPFDSNGKASEINTGAHNHA